MREPNLGNAVRLSPMKPASAQPTLRLLWEQGARRHPLLMRAIGRCVVAHWNDGDKKWWVNG